MTEITPMMKQFRSIKEQYPDALLLFRCGDFYETYCEDAIEASRILNITLTHRSNGKTSAPTEMAGLPFHALDTYLPKLVREGKRVAICDQLEDPKLAKKLVKRGVTELVTPGVSYSDTTPSKDNNFVACVQFGTDKKRPTVGVSFLDISTGEFLVAEDSEDKIQKLLSNFKPKEVLFMRGKRSDFEAVFGRDWYTYELDDWIFTMQAAKDKLLKQFGTQNLKGFGVDSLPNAVIAAGAILHYLDMTQHLQTDHIKHLGRIEQDRYVWLDNFTIRNLELTSGMNSEAKSLLDILNYTVSPMGQRLLRRWVTFPLKEVRAIRARQTVVEYFFRNPDLRDELRDLVGRIQDLERLVGKVSTGRIGPREMLQIGRALEAIDTIKQLCLPADNKMLQTMGENLMPCSDIRTRIQTEIDSNPPAVANKPGVIAKGFSEELDHYRNLQNNAREELMRIQNYESEKTGISSLKVGYNSVFGYYLEVRNTYRDRVPDDWIRKQTLVNAERYITPELKTYEEEISVAEQKASELETRLYMELMLATLEYVADMQSDAILIAQLDCLLSFAVCAAQNKYVCPDVDDSLVIDIRQGRHPVIEQQLPIGEQYIANDILLDNNGQQIIILTGPNMAGKSALLRQTALIVLMAQIGSFVPAESAKIGVVDKIFTRVGASDNISLGESTFMVEMNEASSILNNLSERSLVLFDELGRGTSTYDGISIAWAIVEYIHEHLGHAKTLFATHYHELNEMEKSFSRIRNYNVSVKEINGKVIFLRKLSRGGSEHSFGIHVAKLAGMPPSILKRANEVLAKLEGENLAEDKKKVQTLSKPMQQIGAERGGMQLSFFQLDDPVLEQIRDEVTKMDINTLTPLEALNKLSEIKTLVGGK